MDNIGILIVNLLILILLGDQGSSYNFRGIVNNRNQEGANYDNRDSVVESQNSDNIIGMRNHN